MYSDIKNKIFYNDYYLRVGDQIIKQPTLNKLIYLYSLWDLFTIDKLDLPFEVLLYDEKDLSFMERWFEHWGISNPKILQLDQWKELTVNGILINWAMSEEIKSFTKPSDEDKMIQEIAPRITLFDQAKNFAFQILGDLSLCDSLSYNEIIRLANQKSFIRLASDQETRDKMLYDRWLENAERLSNEEVLDLLNSNKNHFDSGN